MNLPDFHIRIKALFLAALVLSVSIIRDTHQYFTPHEYSETCDAQGAKQHLHGVDYQVHHCPLCDFTFQPTDLAGFFYTAFQLRPERRSLLFLTLPGYFPLRTPPSGCAARLPCNIFL